MSYLDDVENELREFFNPAEHGAAETADMVVKFVRSKLLESYKNGAQAERKRSSQNKSSKAPK